MLDESDSEDELPPFWEERVAQNGRVYYANHQAQSTQWTHPTNGKFKRVRGSLPFGWQMKIDNDGYLIYEDTISNRTTYTDPRLAFAISDSVDGEPDPDTSDAQLLEPTSRQLFDSAVSQISRFDSWSTALQVLDGLDLSDKHAVVTGGTSGVGWETARSLALHGCHVTLACRNVARARTLIAGLERERAGVGALCLALQCDLASLASVRRFAHEYVNVRQLPCDFLVLSAGVLMPPHTFTVDGFELSFQTNHLAHFYLFHKMLPALRRCYSSRVIVVSCESHRQTSVASESKMSERTLSPDAAHYWPLQHANNTKFLNVLFSLELHARFCHERVFSYAVHPGSLLPTRIHRHSWLAWLLSLCAWPFTKSIQQGAACIVMCATVRGLEMLSGRYWNNARPIQPHPATHQPNVRRALWELSERLCDAFEESHPFDAYEAGTANGDAGAGATRPKRLPASVPSATGVASSTIA